MNRLPGNDGSSHGGDWYPGQFSNNGDGGAWKDSTDRDFEREERIAQDHLKAAQLQEQTARHVMEVERSKQSAPQVQHWLLPRPMVTSATEDSLVTGFLVGVAAVLGFFGLVWIVGAIGGRR